MPVSKLKSIIGGLAQSQGSYGRMRRALDENKSWGKLSRLTIKHNIKDVVDLILFLEG